MAQPSHTAVPKPHPTALADPAIVQTSAQQAAYLLIWDRLLRRWMTNCELAIQTYSGCDYLTTKSSPPWSVPAGEHARRRFERWRRRCNGATPLATKVVMKWMHAGFTLHNRASGGPTYSVGDCCNQATSDTSHELTAPAPAPPRPAPTTGWQQTTAYTSHLTPTFRSDVPSVLNSYMLIALVSATPASQTWI